MIAGDGCPGRTDLRPKKGGQDPGILTMTWGLLKSLFERAQELPEVLIIHIDWDSFDSLIPCGQADERVFVL